MSLLRVVVREHNTQKPLAFRAYLTDVTGAFHRPRSPHVTFERAEERHFLADGEFEAELPSGTYSLRVERGPEYVPYDAAVTLAERDERVHEVILNRWVWMNSCQWYSGDLHVHRKPEEMPLAVQAEGLNVGTNIVVHNAVATAVPDSPRVRLDENTCFSTLDAEIERLFDGMGALVFLGLNEPLPIGEFDALYPPDLHYADLAKRLGGHVDAEKPFWKGVAVNAALGLLDSMGVVPNHFHRNKVMRESARWGAIPQEAQFVGDEGFARWILDLYYRFLNCGIRLPATGGSASGIMPSPVGYCRTYVKMTDAFSYDAWFSTLRTGRSFATNGPMLFLNVQDEEPGGLLRYPLEKPVTLEVRAVGMSQRTLDCLELVRDGEVVERVEGAREGDSSLLEIQTQTTFARSGWLAARCFERHETNVRYAQTSPVYVFMGTDPIACEADALFFRDHVERLIGQIENRKDFREEAHRRELAELFAAARDFYDHVIERARTRPSES